MKILQVNCVYNKGSTGKIVYDIHSELIKQNIESIVCYGRGEKNNEENVYKTCGELYSKFNHFLTRITGVMYGGCFFSTNKLIKIIKKEKPDIVHLHCINGYFVNIYRILEFLKDNKIKTVITLHAEFMYTANCGHSLDCEKWKTGCKNCSRYKQETKSFLFNNTHLSWKKMQKSFKNFNTLSVVSVSPWLMERAKQSPFLNDKKHFVVMNGLDINIFKKNNTSDLKEKYQLTNEKIIFHATPYFTDDKNYIKGGYYILELAKRLENKNIKIFVAGDYKKNMNLPSNIILLGKINNQVELAKFYSMADLTVLTSKKETFSMITAESLCCGTPVVGFTAGGPESIAIRDYCSFVSNGDIDLLIQTTLLYLDKSFDSNLIEQKSHSVYSKKRMLLDYNKIYKN